MVHLWHYAAEDQLKGKFIEGNALTQNSNWQNIDPIPTVLQ